MTKEELEAQAQDLETLIRDKDALVVSVKEATERLTEVADNLKWDDLVVSRDDGEVWNLKNFTNETAATLKGCSEFLEKINTYTKVWEHDIGALFSAQQASLGRLNEMMFLIASMKTVLEDKEVLTTAEIEVVYLKTVEAAQAATKK